MQLALIRHGQTDWNLEDRMQGRTDVPLNDTGRLQALTAAQGLDRDWDLVVCSPLLRAHVTAEIVATELGLDEPITDEELVERAYGEGEGLKNEVIYAMRERGIQIVGEESMVQLTWRAVGAVDRIASSLEVEKLIVVSHGTFMRAFVEFWTGEEFATPGNGGVVRVSGEPGAWFVEVEA